MSFELFGFQFSKKRDITALQPEDGKPIKTQPESIVPSESDDGSIVIDEVLGGFHNQTLNLEGIFKSDNQRILKYRKMSLHAEVETAIDGIVNEAIVVDDAIKNPVTMVLDDVNEKVVPKSVQNKIQKEFEWVLKLLRFKKKGWEIFRRWYVDGRLYYHIILDSKQKDKGIVELRHINPIQIKKLKEIEKKEKRVPNQDGIMSTVQIITGEIDYYLFTSDKENPQSPQIRISPEAICFVNSGMTTPDGQLIVGYLEKAIKPLNQLTMIEDATIIYRITRAPERRIFYIDVGSLPKHRAEQYLRDVMARYKNKLVYDASTGELQNDNRFMSMLEDFWLPRREGGRGTEIDTLSGGENLGEMQVVEFFKRKLYRSLNVPSSRLESDSGFQMGKATEINRDELIFFKSIERMRTKFSDLFLHLLKTQLILKRIIKKEDWDKIKDDIGFDWARDSYFTETKTTEIMNSRLSLLNDINDYIGKYYSIDWVRKNILYQTSEEIKEMDDQIDVEREEGLLDTNNADNFGQ